MKREPAILFYPRFALETLRKFIAYRRSLKRMNRIRLRVRGDPGRYGYTDLAVRPVDPTELESLDLFQETKGGEAAVARQRRQEAIRTSVRAAHENAA